MSAAAESTAHRHAAGDAGRLGHARAGDWARRAPLLPALIFMIIVTQLPFVVTLVISFMNWNAYYPDERGFAGLDNYRRVFTDANTRSRDRRHDRAHRRPWSSSAWSSAWASRCCSTASSAAAASCAR